MKPLPDAVAAVEAVVAAGQAPGIAFNLNARTDAIAKAPAGADPAEVTAEVIRRGRAFLDAGATSFFVPRLTDTAAIEQVVAALGRGKLSLIAFPGMGPSVKEMEDLGVCRVSTGPFSQRVALTALQDTAIELLAGGVLPPGTRALN
jgi:2-methylisocitrate lyase-like PEP mutase family enzyme